MSCLFHKWKISGALDNDSLLNEETKRHLLKCRPCREFFNSSVSLAEGLASQAVVSSPDIPVRLRKRIGRAISGGGTQAQVSQVRRTWAVRGRLAAACVMLVAVLGLVAVGVFHRDGISTQASTAGATAQLQRIFGTDKLTAGNLTESIPGFLERPVTGELRNLADQTESAVEFLLACVTVSNPIPELQR